MKSKVKQMLQIYNIKYSNTKQTRMLKPIFILTMLIALCLSLQISHSSQKPENNHMQSSAYDEQDAGLRLLDFINGDRGLQQAMRPGNHPTPQQTKRVKDFMIDDPFYQNRLIKQLDSDPDNKWLESLSKQGKLRYLRIANTYPENQITKDTIKQNQKRIINDPEIGPLLQKKQNQTIFGTNNNSSSTPTIAPTGNTNSTNPSISNTTNSVNTTTNNSGTATNTTNNIGTNVTGYVITTQVTRKPLDEAKRQDSAGTGNSTLVNGTGSAQGPTASTGAQPTSKVGDNKQYAVTTETTVRPL